MVVGDIVLWMYEYMDGLIVTWLSNKHAAQAAGADPCRCNSINRQNQHIQQNCRNF